MIDMAMMKFVEQVGQDANYKLGDLISSFPEPLRPIAVGALLAALNAAMETMTEVEKEAVEAIKNNSKIVILPTMFDPRRG